jgi:uncharacterized membrane protein
VLNLRKVAVTVILAFVLLTILIFNSASAQTIDRQQQTTETSHNEALKQADDWLVYGTLGTIVVAAIVILVFFFVRSRRKVQVAEGTKEKRQIDSERIFMVHPDLLPEEKQSIQFLAENDGEAFEADLYDKLNLPRATVWSLIKRLEKMDVIERVKFKRRNLVRIKRRYTLKE